MAQQKDFTTKSRRSQQEIDSLLLKFSESGVTVKHFCSEHHIKPATFHKWQAGRKGNSSVKCRCHTSRMVLKFKIIISLYALLFFISCEQKVTKMLTHAMIVPTTGEKFAFNVEENRLDNSYFNGRCVWSSRTNDTSTISFITLTSKDDRATFKVSFISDEGYRINDSGCNFHSKDSQNKIRNRTNLKGLNLEYSISKIGNYSDIENYESEIDRQEKNLFLAGMLRADEKLSNFYPKEVIKNELDDCVLPVTQLSFEPGAVWIEIKIFPTYISVPIKLYHSLEKIEKNTLVIGIRTSYYIEDGFYAGAELKARGYLHIDKTNMSLIRKKINLKIKGIPVPGVDKSKMGITYSKKISRIEH